MYAKIRRENLTSARYTISKTRKRFYYAEVRIMTSTMDVDDRSDSDDDEEIVERGAFNALVVVCATKILYTLFLFLSGLRSQREREKGGDRNKYFFLFVFNDKERIQRRETRRSTVSALVPSRFLSNRARRERLCVVVKASIDGGRWTL